MKNSEMLPDFNFNEWSNLANTDPEEFERRRQQAIEETILAMPKAKQQRIRGLQWRIDQERKLSKSPIAACIKLSGMMWDTVVGEHGLLQSVKSLEKPSENSLLTPRNNLLMFPESSA